MVPIALRDHTLKPFSIKLTGAELRGENLMVERTRVDISTVEIMSGPASATLEGFKRRWVRLRPVQPGDSMVHWIMKFHDFEIV